MFVIENIFAREVLDSRGNPTVEVDCVLQNGGFGRAIVPSGASTGSHESIEIRDKVAARYKGKGVENAVANVNKIIAPAIIGMNSCSQACIDNKMKEIDGTSNKSKLGANAILGVSLAVAKATANALGIPLYRYIGGVNARRLPVPMCNVLNGGAHADNNVDIQEFMIFPEGAPNFKEAIRWAAEIFHTLKSILKKRGLTTSVGDEGGYAPNLSNNAEALQVITQAIKDAGYEPRKQVNIALDAAANSFYYVEIEGKWHLAEDLKKKDNLYMIDGKSYPATQIEGLLLHGKYKIDGVLKSSDELIEYYKKLIAEFPIVSLEDGLYEDDWAGWKKMKNELGSKIQLVGDDIFVTTLSRIERGIKEDCANSVLIKLNQIGTLTETIEAVQKALRNKWTAVISHRSGETEDTTIADFAVAMETGQIKTGSLSRTDRIAKYNQLIRIEEELGASAEFGRI